MINLFKPYLDGSLLSVLEGMSVKELQKIYRGYGIGRSQTKDRDKLIEAIMVGIDKQANKGHAFM